MQTLSGDIEGLAGAPPKISVLGVGVSAVTLDAAIAEMDRWIAKGVRSYICVTGAHGLIESQSDPGLRAIHNAAGLVVPDGMPVVWLLRLLTELPVGRVCGFDLLPDFARHAAGRGYRHFFYGAGPGVPERLAERLSARFPGFAVAGTLSPPFRPLTAEEDSEIVRTINAARPDVIWVGLSTPKQERWMAEHRDRLDAPVLIGVGAAFDTEAGEKRRSPLWMQRAGLEWFFRLCSEPGRLWLRYARIVPLFLGLGVLQIAKARRPVRQPAGRGSGDAQ